MFEFAKSWRRYAQAPIAVSKAKAFLAGFLACLRVPDLRSYCRRHSLRIGDSAAIAAHACYSRVRPQVWDALLCLSRSLAQAKQLRPELQRQRLPDDERT